MSLATGEERPGDRFVHHALEVTADPAQGFAVIQVGASQQVIRLAEITMLINFLTRIRGAM